MVLLIKNRIKNQYQICFVVVETEASSVCAFHDESEPWVIYSDIDKTLSGLSKSHPDQVEGYKRYLKDALPVARLALDLAATPPSSLNFASKA